MDKDTEFRRRLISTFKAEAQEHISTIMAGVIELERMPPVEVQMEIVETVFREAHSLKGAARAVGIPEIESLCQALEGVFSQWKMRRINQSRDLFDVICAAMDTVRSIVASTETGAEPCPERAQAAGLAKELDSFASGGPSVMTFQGRGQEVIKRPPSPDQAALEEAKTPAREAIKRPAQYPRDLSSDTVRVSTGKLGLLLMQAEEMLPLKSVSSLNSALSAEIEGMLKDLKDELGRYGRLPAGKGAAASQDTGEIFSRVQARLKAMDEATRALSRSSRQHGRALGRMIDGLLEEVKQSMLMPFSSVLDGFPMLLRDICRKKGKEADLVITGEGAEIDRRILEEIKDPLIHLVRNCVDHGIERPSEREGKGKPRRGTVAITMAHLEGKAEVTVSDDGGGIDMEKVKAAAVKNGVVDGAEAAELGEEEALSLIFHSGLSTSHIITDLSGRGLGLAIVREKIERLGGSVTVESSPLGTKFRLFMPLTIATFRGILALAGGQTFIIPVSSVERTLRVKASELSSAGNRETVYIHGEPYSFAWLDAVLEIPPRPRKNDGFITMLLLASGGRKMAFGIDEMAGEEEILVKGLGPQLALVRNISGAAILGDGRPAPLINVPDLLRSAMRPSPSIVPLEAAEPKAISVLVAEDSITSRMLLKNILESAGYSVRTAVDGVDAYTLLKTEPFDLLVSDIEMPRMDGFELTSKVRNDKALSELPVVLVTALETREDREKGIESGANAYIVKSSFNQNNLLEIIRRLAG